MSTIYFQGRKIYIFCRKVLHRVVGGEVGAGEVQNTEKTSEKISFFIIIIFFISWRLITLQYCSGFCHALT